MASLLTINAVLDDGTRLNFKGRDAWALQELVTAGDRGLTPLDVPGPRWSAYVHKLRRAGLDVETVHEEHGGRFPGRHARYVLLTPVVILAPDEGGAA